jgi:ribonuclease D
MQPALYASTEAELDQALHKLAGSDFVALDTEFMRESTYFPRLCLVQAATADCCVLIDPLAISNLRALWAFLVDPRRLKVLHAARQDLETLSLSIAHTLPDAGPTVPGPLFDTQIAAGLLGHAGQIGYGGLVEARLQHVLTKGHARTDWTRRPLSAEQLSYAADDVRYLVPLYSDLRDALDAAGRTAWAFEENAALEDPRLYRTEPADAWRRLKGLERLQPAQRATIKLLAAWREVRAMKSDKPRGWILPDEALREIAERRPQSLADLEQIRSLAEGTLKRQGEELLRLVNEGQAAAATESESFTPQRPEPRAVALVSRLMNVVRAEAEKLRIAPELLVTRKDIEQLAYSGLSDHLRRGWRREVIGERLIALAGEA